MYVCVIAPQVHHYTVCVSAWLLKAEECKARGKSGEEFQLSERKGF